MNAAPTTPALSLHGVTKTYGKVKAVSGLDLEFDQGKVLALLGPNGAGKTTTVEICEGFIRPDSGEVRVLGLDPTRETDQLRSRIGIMLQGGGAYPGIRVEEMLRLLSKYSANPLNMEWLLEVVGLQRHRKTNYRRLSGGQQQRLSLACALIGRPELVFLDEPTAGLDAQSRLAVWDLVESMRRDGVSIVLTTHLMDEAEALSDDVVIIDRGQVVAAGPTKEITQGTGRGSGNAQKKVALDIDGHPNLYAVNAAFASAGIAANLDSQIPGKFVLTGEVTPETIALLAQQCVADSALIRNMQDSARTLEEVFLDVTGREMRS